MGGERSPLPKQKSTYPVRAPKPVGKWIEKIYRDKIGQFYGRGQYEHQNLVA